MIFHLPVPFDPASKFGNDVRPVNMLRAFEDLGYNVTTISGRVAERAAKMREVRERVLAGEVFDFCYSESSVPPTALLEPHRVPVRPFLEPEFFRFLKAHNIPCGLFYRDVYWKFEVSKNFKDFIRNGILGTFHTFDLWMYRFFVPRLFLPSLEMGPYVPIYPARRFRALPPGHSGTGLPAKREVSEPLEILYVGGLSDMYDLRMFARVISESQGVHLTICTREQDWARNKAEYEPFLGANVSVVHAGGADLLPLYEKADVAAIYLEPNEYRAFAAAIKFFEYMGHHTPVLASAGTYIGNQVLTDGIGWTIPYEESAARAWLADVIAHPEEIQTRSERLAEVGQRHSWNARAENAARELNLLR